MTGLANGAVQLGWLSLGPLSDSTDGVPGSEIWKFSAPDSYFDYLADGETVTLTYTVEVDDHHGGCRLAGHRRHRQGQQRCARHRRDRAA